MDHEAEQNKGNSGGLDESTLDNVDQTYLAFARRALHWMGDWADQGKLRETESIYPVFTETGFGFEHEARLVFWDCICREYGPEIWGTPEAIECVRNCLAAGVYKPPTLYNNAGDEVPPTLEALVPILLRQVLNPIARVLEHNGSMAATDAELLEEWHRHRASLAEVRPPARYFFTATVPVHNLIAEVPHLIKAQRLSFQRLSPEQKTSLFRIWHPMLFELNIMEFADVDWQLSAEYEELEPHQSHFEDYCRDARDIITAFRLHKEGSIGVVTAFLWSSRGYGNSSHVPDCQVRLSRADQYVLLAEDIEPIQQIYDALCRISGLRDEDRRTLQFAIRRFNQAYSRSNPEDRLLDYVIALESLLVPEGAELGLKFGLYGAALLATDQARAGELVKLLRTAYNVRSRIVHDGEILGELSKGLKSAVKQFTDNPAHFPEALQGVVRDIVKRFVFRAVAGQTIKSIRAKLDERVIAGVAVAPAASDD